MADIQVAVLNKSTPIRNKQAQPSIPALSTQRFARDSSGNLEAQAQLHQDLAREGKTESPKQLLCIYVNSTSKVQIARITNIANWYFERVVFPGQRLLFEALPQAQLEIHTGMTATAILSDRISCRHLACTF
ncbi:MAG: DUF1830 domain-containing protein [Chroococcidiopsidaceae cyanobacterium CP_BM_ER_R8_30]|nr:DUF1830 domain-containing protein [Chroococcidiopsidaceae cyanobacterium CP_BM_ER_R8_30]